MILSYIFSLGCGIGYGYLHRIPSEIVEQKQKNRAGISVPGPPTTFPTTSQPPAAGAAPGNPDGFSDVRTHP